MALIDDLEFLAERMNALREAEELAFQSDVDVIDEIRRLLYESMEEFVAIAHKLLKSAPKLEGAPKLPLELIERLFAILRNQAEAEWTRSLKQTGKEARKARQKADDFAKLARSAAISLKIAAEVVGVWNEQYAKEHGVNRLALMRVRES